MYYQTVGMFEKAFDFMFRALYILEITSGESHPDVAAMYLNMGHMYSEIDQNQASIDSYHKALNSYVNMYGESTLQVAIIHQYLASAYQNFKTALEHQVKCHHILETLFTEEHPLVAKSKL